MTDAVPPPVPARPAPRPPVPFAATCLTLVLGFAATMAVCLGGVVVGLAHDAAPRIAAARAARARIAATQVLVEDARAMLESMAARISAAARGAGELPEVLDEAPPKDPWGHPVEYDRSAPDRAVLRSAGPDGRLGTKDDVRREVVK